jgi:hypothetical protein
MLLLRMLLLLTATAVAAVVPAGVRNAAPTAAARTEPATRLRAGPALLEAALLTPLRAALALLGSVPVLHVVRVAMHRAATAAAPVKALCRLLRARWRPPGPEQLLKLHLVDVEIIWPIQNYVTVRK